MNVPSHPGPPPRTMQDAVERLGLTYHSDAGAGFHRTIDLLRGLFRSGRSKHLSTGTLSGRELIVFQHTSVVQTGQAPVAIEHTAYVTSAPPSWPDLRVMKRSLLARLLHRMRLLRGIELDDPVFNALMQVRPTNVEFAITLLSPELQRFMLEKRSVIWKTGRGRVALIYRGRVRPARVEASIDRLRRFWSLVPDELLAWDDSPERQGGAVLP